MTPNIYPVYAIRDNVGCKFGSLIVESNEATARRNFAYGCRDGLMAFKRDDFALYCIGRYNVDSGAFEPLPVPEYICSAAEVVTD